MRLGRMRNDCNRSAARLEAWTTAGCVGVLILGDLSLLTVTELTLKCGARYCVPLCTCVPLVVACGLPIRPVLKHGPRSLTCVQVNGYENLLGERKLIDRIPKKGALSTDLDLLRRVRV